MSQSLSRFDSTMKPPVVVHLIDGLSVGGAESALFRLVSDPDAAREHPRVIAFMQGGEVLERMRQAGLAVETLGLRRGQISPRAFLTLRQRLVAIRPHVVVTWSATANLVGAIVARFCGSPRVVWNIRRSALRPDDSSRVTAWAIRFCSRLSGRIPVIIANSEAARAAHEAMGYAPAAWTIIPNGFDLHEFKPDPAARSDVRDELGIERDAPLVGIAGRWNPGKDHATFLRAAESLVDHRPDVHYLMAGSGLNASNDQLKAMAPRLLEAHALHLLGVRHDMPRLLAALDVFTLTSLSEGFPNVVGEAMACGVPCVVTQTAGDAPTIIGEAGYTIPAGDPAALMRRWIEWFSLGADQQAELGASARKRIEECYSIDLMRGRYRDFYATIQEGSA